jgi:hypothetical protein
MDDFSADGYFKRNFVSKLIESLESENFAGNCYLNALLAQ